MAILFATTLLQLINKYFICKLIAIAKLAKANARMSLLCISMGTEWGY